MVNYSKFPGESVSARVGTLGVPEVGKEFEQWVFSDEKDVFLEVYAPWCAPSGPTPALGHSTRIGTCSAVLRLTFYVQYSVRHTYITRGGALSIFI